MKNNRRTFLKHSGLAGLGLATGNMAASYAGNKDDVLQMKPATLPQHFNMCGYAAPPLNVVRTGFVGLGNRGMAAVERIIKIEGVEIKAICDLRAERVATGLKTAEAYGHHPETYSGHAEAWKKLCERTDIDLIYILTPWALHTPIAVFAMTHGKHVCVEVPAAKTIEECWQLVHTSERTKKHCMMLENCCYDFSEMLTLNMARHGFFGEITHCEGAYIHGLLDLIVSKDRFYQMWELAEAYERKGNLYPTHGLGPLCQVMNINRGDRMDYLVSVSNNDFMLGERVNRLAATDDFYKPFAGKLYNGTMNTTTIRTVKGKTIMLQYDIYSPRPYSRIQLVSGTKAVSLKYPEPARYAVDGEWLSSDEYKKLEEKYTPPIIKKIGEVAKKVGGHGGMDFLMDWRTIDCLRNGLPLDQDVYDAALWSAIAPLTEWSVANRSNSIDVPDFTDGAWQKNTPVDILMEKGGNTGVRGG